MTVQGYIDKWKAKLTQHGGNCGCLACDCAKDILIDLEDIQKQLQKPVLYRDRATRYTDATGGSCCKATTEIKQ